MALFPLDIEDLIPHRGRMKLIGEIVEVDDDKAVTASMVTENWPLLDGPAVDPIVLIEIIAQTAGISISYRKKQAGEKKKEGHAWIVGIRSADFFTDRIPLHTRLVAKTQGLYSQENYSVIEGTVESASGLLCRVVLQVFREITEPKGEQGHA